MCFVEIIKYLMTQLLELLLNCCAEPNENGFWFRVTLIIIDDAD